MSGSEIIALAAVIISGVVGIATLGFNFWSQSRQRSHALERLKLEHEERYKSDLYAKRLEVHQRAYLWLMQLIEPLRSVMDAASPIDRKVYLGSMADNARGWWDSNCLYLDDDSRSAVVDFIELAKAMAGDNPPVDEDRPISAYVKALKLVQEGIGMKHLDVSEPKRNVS